MREKERIIEKLVDEKKVLERLNREQDKQLTELKEEYKKSSNVSQSCVINRLIWFEDISIYRGNPPFENEVKRN